MSLLKLVIKSAEESIRAALNPKGPQTNGTCIAHIEVSRLQLLLRYAKQADEIERLSSVREVPANDCCENCGGTGLEETANPNLALFCSCSVGMALLAAPAPRLPTPKHDALVAALKASRAYVAGAYECAFPDADKNEKILRDIDAALEGVDKS